ncbi:hypothetical protein ACFYZ9_19980 [Streptomyces sp. NPDC001691]|nr:hypothetical protein [Streptomyces sp. SDr-06]
MTRPGYDAPGAFERAAAERLYEAASGRRYGVAGGAEPLAARGVRL